jgi:aspartate/methionine/tyrosine aminotransferase
MGERLKGIPGFSIDKVAAAAGSDPEMLRMENLDTDIPPPAGAVEATRAAVGTDEANSWLPFTGMRELKHEVARMIVRRGGPQYDPDGEVVITSGEGDNMLDALLALTDPGDEVIVPDPTYAGMLQRVRLAGDVPRLIPLHPSRQGWRWDLDALEAAVSDRTQAIFLGNPSFPSGWVLNERNGRRCAASAPSGRSGSSTRARWRRSSSAGGRSSCPRRSRGCAISPSRWAASPANSG